MLRTGNVGDFECYIVELADRLMYWDFLKKPNYHFQILQHIAEKPLCSSEGELAITAAAY